VNISQLKLRSEKFGTTTTTRHSAVTSERANVETRKSLIVKTVLYAPLAVCTE
jgi:hypothetical protein